MIRRLYDTGIIIIQAFYLRIRQEALPTQWRTNSTNHKPVTTITNKQNLLFLIGLGISDIVNRICNNDVNGS